MKQRNRKSLLSTKHKQRLDAIGFVWDRQDQLWEQAFTSLLKFKRREGHCCPSRHHVEGNFNLGSWVSTQRSLKNLLPLERKRRLDAIGFVWNRNDDRWERGFTALLKFKRREGHCRVPVLHSEGNYKLGRWVSVQRGCRRDMSAERKARLNKIAFVWNAASGITGLDEK